MSTPLLARFLILATLASCHADPPQAPPLSPSPDATGNSQDRETTLTSDPGAAAAASPSGPLLLTPDGWGPLRIGMTRAEVVSASGEDANPAAAGGPDPGSCDEFHPSQAPAGILVMVERGVLTRISVSRNEKIKTLEGFGVGDSGSRILEHYGSRARVDRHQYWPAPAKYITVWREAQSETDRRGIRYEIDSAGKVVHIRAGAPSIENVEGCL